MENRVTEVEQAIVERNITLGVDLIALRNAAGSNREFSSMARRAYDIDPARAALYRASLGPMGTGETSPAA